MCIPDAPRSLVILTELMYKSDPSSLPFHIENPSVLIQRVRLAVCGLASPAALLYFRAACTVVARTDF